MSLPKLEVRRIRRRQHAGNGYVGYETIDVHQLGYQTFFGFKVVDEEVIPSDIMISLGAFGDCGRPWKSKFANWISQTRGGNAEDFA